MYSKAIGIGFHTNHHPPSDHYPRALRIRKYKPLFFLFTEPCKAWRCGRKKASWPYARHIYYLSLQIIPLYKKNNFLSFHSVDKAYLICSTFRINRCKIRFNCIVVVYSEWQVLPNYADGTVLKKKNCTRQWEKNNPFRWLGQYGWISLQQRSRVVLKCLSSGTKTEFVFCCMESVNCKLGKINNRCQWWVHCVVGCCRLAVH